MTALLDLTVTTGDPSLDHRVIGEKCRFIRSAAWDDVDPDIRRVVAADLCRIACRLAHDDRHARTVGRLRQTARVVRGRPRPR